MYVLAMCWKFGANKLNWDNSPGWAKPLDDNTMITSREERHAERPRSNPALPRGVGMRRR